MPGIKVSGLIFDAGPVNSPVLVQIGGRNAGGTHDAQRSDAPVQDVFFRIGGAEPGQATTSLVVNADNAILDDIWAWRADHGNGVGWTNNTRRHRRSSSTATTSPRTGSSSSTSRSTK